MARASATAALAMAGALFLVATCVMHSKATVLEENTTSAAATDWKPQGKVPTVPFFDEWYVSRTATKACTVQKW